MYVPNYTDGNCAVYRSDRFIRVYEQEPYVGGHIDFVDYDLLAHYQNRTGTEYFPIESDVPTCLVDIDSNYYHRVDILDIILLFTLFVGWTWFLVSKLIKTLLHGGKRL